MVLVGIRSALSDALARPKVSNSIDGLLLENIMKKKMKSNDNSIDYSTPTFWSTETTMLLKNIHFAIDFSFEIMFVETILCKSRNFCSSGSCETYNSFSSMAQDHNKVAIYMENIGSLLDSLNLNIETSFQKLFIESSWDEGFVKITLYLSDVKSVVFNFSTKLEEDTSYIEPRILPDGATTCLHQFSLPTCSCSLYAGFREFSRSLHESHTTVESSFLRSSRKINQDSDEFEAHLCGSDQKPSSHQLSPADYIEPDTNFVLQINIELDPIFMLGCSSKDIMSKLHRPNKLICSVHTDGDFCAISCDIQGGTSYIETSSLATLINCYHGYLLCIANMASPHGNVSFGKHAKTTKESVSREENVRLGKSSEPRPTHSTKWIFPEVFVMILSQLSLVLLVSDGSESAQGMILEADFQFDSKITNSRRKLSFALPRLTICCQKWHEHSVKERQPRDGEISYFLSYRSYNLGTSEFQCSTSPLIGQNAFKVDVGQTSSAEIIHNKNSFIKENCILESLSLSFMIEEKPSRDEGFGQNWTGSGSISGFDLKITLSEIQMFLKMISPLSLVSVGKSNLDLKHQSKIQRRNDFPESALQDGAIVAIRDVDQHMYFAVQDVEGKGHLVGTIHYSLVGERALFRVKYPKKRGRGSASWFSLISLYANNNIGEPLCLNYLPGSCYVHLSKSDDIGRALWRAIWYKPEILNGYDDLDLSSPSVRRSFYLVNQKSDSAIAFIDDIPEFVKKPGNLFKIKEFPDLQLTHGVLTSSSCGDTCQTSEVSGQDKGLSHIVINMDKAKLTILHEAPDMSDNVPLLQAIIDNAEFNVQMMSSKSRLICMLQIAFYCFDGQSNIWREISSLIEICCFSQRSSPEYEYAEVMQECSPVSFHMNLRQVNISLTELALDALLFVAGVMNLAGPYAVRSSLIHGNLCKVENCSGLSLLCHFGDNRDTMIYGKQFTSVPLRHLAFSAEPSESRKIVSFQLTAPGFSTLPISLSLSNEQTFAWRTRIISLEDSRTFPGPFIAAEISRDTELGLSLVISPLLRIHNESGFSMELRFQRPQLDEESAYVFLKNGETLDDSMVTFDAIKFSGGTKKALMSLGLGNFLLSFRPELDTEDPILIEWSENLRGGKAVCISGLFDKLNYRLRRVLGVESLKSSLDTVQCSLVSEGRVSNLHFLIQTIRRVMPVMKSFNMETDTDIQKSPVAIQEQKEIFISPTIQVSNLLQSDIFVVLSENYPDSSHDYQCIGKQAAVHSGSSSYFYANLSDMYFSVTLTSYNTRCRPVNSSEWVKVLRKHKFNVPHLDVDLEFEGGKYFASLRLSRGNRGILEATLFTSYTLHNDTDICLFCIASDQKPLAREEVHKYNLDIPPEIGLILPPMSSRSWFMKSNRVRLQYLEDKTSETTVDLDSLSGFTEALLEVEEKDGLKRIVKLGLSLKPFAYKVYVPSQIVSIVPRFIIFNESEEDIIARQCFLEVDTCGIVTIARMQRRLLHLWRGSNKRREISFFDSMIGKNKKLHDDSLTFFQFCPKEAGWSWSGSICIASLGRFFLKFRRSLVSRESNSFVTSPEIASMKFATVEIVEEGSSLVLHFHMPPKVSPPYRIENHLHDTPITYYQKESTAMEILGPQSTVEYVWDDLNSSHKLILHINGVQMSREINIDKICSWKPFIKIRPSRGLSLNLPLDKKFGVQTKNISDTHEHILKIGFGVYADGSSRVLRICEFTDYCSEEDMSIACMKLHVRMSCFSVRLLGNLEKDIKIREQSIYVLLVARLGKVSLDTFHVDGQMHNHIRVQSIDIDEKWPGAPFAAMLRRNQRHSDEDTDIFRIIIVLYSTKKSVIHVKYLSMILQPIDLNIDEEMLMRLVPFWRTSLGQSYSPSRQFYFKHFEIHPIKIVASFIPGTSDSSYSSAQESLRSLLHSVIKIPSLKNKVVELNGILVTHGLLTVRELIIKCMQHYSWYGLRAVYIAKGSPLLPPMFASIFDDSASSSLDVFFDPSTGLVNLPGLTLGMFKFISKCIDAKGFSGTKRYLGDLRKTIKTAGSNVLFAAATEISDSVLKGAEANGFSGMVNGFHQGILRLAMEPSFLGTAVFEGGPDRKIKLDCNPGPDEFYIEGYLQAMLDMTYKQDYLRVKVIDDQVILKNLPPNSSLINEIMESVKGFLVSKMLLKGETMTAMHPSMRHLRGEREWKLVPTALTLCEHLFVSFVIRALRKQADKLISSINWRHTSKEKQEESMSIIPSSSEENQPTSNRKWVTGKFVVSGMLAYIDGRLCRCIPNAIARRIVSGFLLSFLDKFDEK